MPHLAGILISVKVSFLKKLSAEQNILLNLLFFTHGTDLHLHSYVEGQQFANVYFCL